MGKGIDHLSIDPLFSLYIKSTSSKKTIRTPIIYLELKQNIKRKEMWLLVVSSREMNECGYLPYMPRNN